MERKKFVIHVFFMLLLFLIALAGCSGVISERDKNANLGTLRTYAWKMPDIKSDSSEFNSSSSEKIIKQNIEKELADQGLSRNDQDPDIYVLYHTFTQTREQPSGSFYSYPPLSPGYSSLYGPYGYGGLSYSYGVGTKAYGNGLGYPAPYFYTLETIIIEFIDAKTNKVIWRGSSDNDVSDASHIDKIYSKEVHAIMKNYSKNSDKMVKHSSL